MSFTVLMTFDVIDLTDTNIVIPDESTMKHQEYS
jgi:hypothetical protein